MVGATRSHRRARIERAARVHLAPSPNHVALPTWRSRPPPRSPYLAEIGPNRRRDRRDRPPADAPDPVVDAAERSARLPTCFGRRRLRKTADGAPVMPTLAGGGICVVGVCVFFSASWLPCLATGCSASRGAFCARVCSPTDQDGLLNHVVVCISARRAASQKGQTSACQFFARDGCAASLRRWPYKSVCGRLRSPQSNRHGMLIEFGCFFSPASLCNSPAAFLMPLLLLLLLARSLTRTVGTSDFDSTLGHNRVSCSFEYNFHWLATNKYD